MKHEDTELQVALLRGINVGGRHKVPMAELRVLFAEQGCSEVRTLIQSGNVVFRPPDAVGDLESRLAAAIEQRFGFPVPVIMRSASQLRAIHGSNPFPTEGEDPRFLHVGFLSRRPEPEVAAALDTERWAPDRFQVRGQELYLHYPKGTARSKMTVGWFDRQLGVVTTSRNWRTVGKLVALCGPT